MGRPTKLDDLTAKRIIDALAAGVSRRGACEAVYVDQSTLTRWLQTGRDTDEEPYCTFRTRLLAAEAKAERRVVDALMQKIEDGDVRAIQIWLQQRRPNEWGKRTEVANESDPTEMAALGDDEATLESLLAAARSRKAG